MRIAMIAPIGEPVPPVGYGGTERIVAWLVDGLVERGHDVTLFATADSETSAELRGWPAHALRGHVPASGHLAMEMAHLLRAEPQLGEYDIVHCHLGIEAAALTRAWDRPTLHTLHGGIFPEHVPLMHALPSLTWISISNSQRRPAPEAHWLTTIHHGIPLAAYPYEGGKEEYLLHLGRISPEKGTHLAIDAARATGHRLVIAAKVDPVNQDYFDAEIAPRLDPGHIDFVGEVHHGAKIALLQRAKAMLFPICWEEPFGIVMIEAMACGTPVIAFARGSTPEVIVDGRTGYLVHDLSEMVRAIHQLDKLDPMACRQHVEAHFSVDRMVDQYELAYTRCAGKPALRIA